MSDWRDYIYTQAQWINFKEYYATNGISAVRQEDLERIISTIDAYFNRELPK